jgi:RNA polymerase sigma-70 factor (ECF subfamily)
MDSLTSLLHEDAQQSMPPFEMWLQGREDILSFWQGPGAACRGSRLVPTVANGSPAFGQYRPSGPGGRHEPWSLQVLDVRDGRIVGFTMFLDTAMLFPLFGLPPVLEP